MRAVERLELGFFGAIDEWLPVFLEHDPGCAELVQAPYGDARPEKSGSWFVLRLDERGRRTMLEITIRGESLDLLEREKNVDHFYRNAAAALARLEPGLLTDIKVVCSRPGTAVRAAFEAAAERQPLTRLELPEARL